MTMKRFLLLSERYKITMTNWEIMLVLTCLVHVVTYNHVCFDFRDLKFNCMFIDYLPTIIPLFITSLVHHVMGNNLCETNGRLVNLKRATDPFYRFSNRNVVFSVFVLFLFCFIDLSICSTLFINFINISETRFIIGFSVLFHHLYL